jgi:hypothetical protein
MSEFGNRYRKPRIAVICHQFERKKNAPMPNFATKEKLGLAQKLPQKKKKKQTNTVATRFICLIFQ